MPSTSSATFPPPYTDGTQNSCPPQYPPVNAMDEGTFHGFNTLTGEPALNGFNAPLDLPWEQWWSADQSAPVGSLQDGDELTPTSAQTNFLPNGYPCGYESNSLGYSTWPSPNTEYTPMASVAEQASFKQTVASADWQAPPATQQEPRRRERGFAERPSRKSTRRSSVQNDEIKPPSPPESEYSKSRRGSARSGSSASKPNVKPSVKPNGKRDDKTGSKIDKGKPSGKNKKSDDGGGSKKASKTDDGSDDEEFAPGSPLEQAEPATKKIQQRNRIASNKFRIKKKEDAQKLKTIEHDMERTNRDLSACHAGLTHDVYLLKMQLLQHTDCGCEMIQNYIAHEAQRYVKGIGGESPCEGPRHQET